METSEVFKTERECILRNESDNCNRDCASCDLVIDCNEILKAYDKVLDLLEKQERGLIIELPVPIGSIVYSIDSKNEIYRFEISGNFPLGLLRCLMLVWGKEVFATREEAEARLKRGQAIDWSEE